MPHRIVQQVFQQAAQQRRVGVQQGALGGFGLGEGKLAPVGQRALAELRRQLPHQRPGGKSLPPQGLCAVLQLAGEVQVVDEGPETLALGADAACLLPGRTGQGRVPFQLFGPAQNEGQRGAHVVADPRDPLGAGGVPPGEHLALLLQVGAGLVELFGHLPGKAVGGQLHGLALGQRIQPGGHRPQLFCAAPAHQQTDRQPQRQQAQRRRQDAVHHVGEQLGRIVEVILPDATLRHCDDEQAVILRPAEHRVVVEVPPGKAGHVGGGVAAGEVFRQGIAPHHIAVIVQHHGPGVAVHPFFRGVLRPEGKALRRLHHGVRDDAGGIFCLRSVGALPPAQPDDEPDTQHRQHQHHAHCCQHIPPDEPPEGLHAVSSFASL